MNFDFSDINFWPWTSEPYMDNEKATAENREIPAKEKNEEFEMGTCCIRQDSREEKLKNTSGQKTDKLDLETVNKVIDDKDEEIQKQKKIIDRLLEDKVQLQMTLSELNESSKELTKKMAKLSNNDPNLENTNDETSPTKIGKLSDKIYNNDWFDAFVSLKNAGSNELDILKRLSGITTVIYKKCLQKSTAAIRQFLMLSENEDLPSFGKEISTAVLEELEAQAKNTETMTQDCEKNLRRYVFQCAELSWLVVTSCPPLNLEFDAIDKDPKDIKTMFEQYANADRVFCDSEEHVGKVALVIWPAVISEDKIVYNKGCVLVYDNLESVL